MLVRFANTTINPQYITSLSPYLSLDGSSYQRLYNHKKHPIDIKFQLKVTIVDDKFYELHTLQLNEHSYKYDELSNLLTTFRETSTFLENSKNIPVEPELQLQYRHQRDTAKFKINNIILNVFDMIDNNPDINKIWTETNNRLFPSHDKPHTGPL